MQEKTSISYALAQIDEHNVARVPVKLRPSRSLLELVAIASSVRSSVRRLHGTRVLR